MILHFLFPIAYTAVRYNLNDFNHLYHITLAARNNATYRMAVVVVAVAGAHVAIMPIEVIGEIGTGGTNRRGPEPI